jgi:tetratricopeptide (TPR) repeat protein
MSIKFPCPSCKKALTAKDEQAGKKVACPACKNPLVIPQPSSAPQTAATSAASPRQAAEAAPDLPPADVEAAAAALLSDGTTSTPGSQSTIDFTCEYCDAAVSAPVAEAGKRMQCPECRKIVKVPAADKADPSNWRRADKHLPSAAKLPDVPAPDGAWGNLTRTVVSREALEEADAIPEKPEPVPLRQRVNYWTRIVLASACFVAFVLYGYNRYTANREHRAADAAISYAGDANTIKAIGPERIGALHTLAGVYYLRERLPSSDAPLAGERGSAARAHEEFERALRALQEADPRSLERDLALGDLALAIVESGGTKDEQRDKVRSSWEDCLRLVRSALEKIHSPEAKRMAYRPVALRLIDRGQTEGALALASTAFTDAPGDRAAARASVALDLLKKNGDNAAAAKACNELLELYSAKDHPPLAAEVVTLAFLLGKTPPPSGGLPEEDENAVIGMAAGHARKGQLPVGRKEAMAAATNRLKLRALLAVGSATEQGADDLAAACTIALKGVEEPPRETLALLRLVRAGIVAGVPESLLSSVADKIVDPAVRGRAKLELCRARLTQMKQIAGTDTIETVDPQTPASALAHADLARHNARYDRGYFRTAESWSEPQAAFGTLGALIGAQKDGD